SELAPRLPCKGKSVRNRGVSQTMPFLVIPRSLLRGGFINLVKMPYHKTPYRCPYRLSLSSQSSRSCAGPNIKALKDKDLGFANSIRALTVWLPALSFEVPQQPVEGFLIHIMRLPAPKVPDVAGIVNQGGPARLQGHHRVVNPDRKEDGGALLAFSRQGGFDFLLDPLALH